MVLPLSCRKVKVEETMEYAKVFWLGRHTTSPQLGAPVRNVHQAGLQSLRSLGWEQVCCSSNIPADLRRQLILHLPHQLMLNAQVPNDSSALPVFAFTTRKGTVSHAVGPGLPAEGNTSRLRLCFEFCAACMASNY